MPWPKQNAVNTCTGLVIKHAIKLSGLASQAKDRSHISADIVIREIVKICLDSGNKRISLGKVLCHIAPSGENDIVLTVASGNLVTREVMDKRNLLMSLDQFSDRYCKPIASRLGLIQ